MKTTNKSMTLYLVWFVVIVAIGTAMWLFFASKAPNMTQKFSSLPTADAVTTQALTNGNLLIKNATAQYEIIVSSTWYLEKQEHGGITVYPDYNPAKKIPPTCKMEISTLQSQGNVDLDEWLTDHLHDDPTADVVESSRVPSTVSGHPAVTWVGSLNDVSTTLAYVSRDDGTIYEIAPSLIESDEVSGISAGASDDGQCASAFQSLMASFRILL